VQLHILGFGPQFQSALDALGDPALRAARVIAAHRGAFTVIDAGGAPLLAEPTGRLRAGGAAGDWPAVGDWVAVDPGGRIAAVLPRRTTLVRRAAGDAITAQVVAANVDVAFVVAALDGPVNLRRIERYLAVAWDGGAAPVIVLTKADAADDAAAAAAEVESVAAGLPVLVTSAAAGVGVYGLAARLGPGRTGALIGPSGAGKSTLVNALLGDDRQRVSEVRAADHKGRHTTTSRELFVLSGAGMLIDTPGMRELGIWDAAAGLGGAFADIEALAADCRFRDCSHDGEPGCAVTGAVAADRLASWRKLAREQAWIDGKRDAQAARDRRDRWKAIHKAMRVRARIDPKLRGQ